MVLRTGEDKEERAAKIHVEMVGFKEAENIWNCVTE